MEQSEKKTHQENHKTKKNIFKKKMEKMKTVTAIRGRLDMFQRQLEETSRFLREVTQQCVINYIPELKDMKDKKIPINTLALTKVLQLLATHRNNKTMYNEFYNVTKQNYPFIEDLIEHIVETQVELLNLKEDLKRNAETNTFVREPLHALWMFLIGLFYERPKLLVDIIDDLDGTNTRIIRVSLPNFIATCMTFKRTPTLTALSLKSLGGGDMRDDQSEVSDVPKPIHLNRQH